MILPLLSLFLPFTFFGIILAADEVENVLVPSNSSIPLAADEQMSILGIVDRDIFGQDPSFLTCTQLFDRTNEFVNMHSNWENEMDEARNKTIYLIEECNPSIDNQTDVNVQQVRKLLNYQKQMMELECKDQNQNNDISIIFIVAIVFIIAFLLSMVALIILSVLYYRK